MELEHCEFPDDLLYDVENNTWTRVVDNEAFVGITSLLCAIAGKLTSLRMKAVGSKVKRGSSLGTVESGRLVGPIPSPLSGIVVQTNDLAVKRPKIVSDSPYREGWIARIAADNLVAERDQLKTANEARENFQQKIAEYRALCFKAFPDHDLVEIGVECAAVLLRLEELVGLIPLGDVVHVVSDDPTAHVEMVRWADRSGQSLVDWREHQGLFHFIVKKTQG